MLINKTLFTGFSPNITNKQVVSALAFLMLPWKWKKIISGENVGKVEKKMSDYLGGRGVVSFDSGRTALYFALKYLDLKPGQEVLVQAYTCVVVINAIIQAGGVPIYVDIDIDFNMSPDDSERKITDRTKAIIIQHTFGNAADLDKLLKVSQDHSLSVIEDCAHSLGATYKGKKLGTFGAMAVFSFGSDKIISGVRGGALAVKDSSIMISMRYYQDKLPTPRPIKTIQHLLHVPIFYIGKKLYSYGIGKIILYVASRFHIVNKIIYPPEKQGRAVGFYPAKLANSLAGILTEQLDNLDTNIRHRKIIAKMYSEKIVNKKFTHTVFDPESSYLRYPLLVNNPEQVFAEAKRNGIILGDWYLTVIAPKDVNMDNMHYLKNSCPNAENMAKLTINLPTDLCIKEGDAERIIQFVNFYNL